MEVMFMAQTESGSERTDKLSIPNLTPHGLATMGKKNAEELARAQAEFFSTLQETHRHWFDRMQSEARLASEFAREVANADSIPDAVAACQQWTSRRFDMMVDDSKHLLADSKVLKTGALFLSGGLLNGQDGASTTAARKRQS
jgi:hypothetical protein